MTLRVLESPCSTHPTLIVGRNRCLISLDALTPVDLPNIVVPVDESVLILSSVVALGFRSYNL
jgi:hypothetical protein